MIHWTDPKRSSNLVITQNAWSPDLFQKLQCLITSSFSQIPCSYVSGLGDEFGATGYKTQSARFLKIGAKVNVLLCAVQGCAGSQSTSHIAHNRDTSSKVLSIMQIPTKKFDVLINICW